jgi:hypothetical protein
MVQLAISAMIDITKAPNCDDEECMRLILVMRMTRIKIAGITIALKISVSAMMNDISTG